MGNQAKACSTGWLLAGAIVLALAGLAIAAYGVIGVNFDQSGTLRIERINSWVRLASGFAATVFFLFAFVFGQMATFRMKGGRMVPP